MIAGRLAEELHKLGIVDSAPESPFDGFQISLVAIGGKLDTVLQTAAQIVHELDCILAASSANQPRDYEFAVAIKRGPGPCVASFLGRSLGASDILLLGVGEAPNFVALDPAGRDALHMLVVHISADRARINQQLGDGVEAHVSQPSSCPHGLPFTEHVQDQ